MKSICNVPEDILRKQIMLDSIPNCIIIGILIVTTIISFYWFFKSTSGMSVKLSRMLLVLLMMSTFGIWFQSSALITKTATNLFNSEFAVIQKFAEGCPAVLQK